MPSLNGTYKDTKPNTENLEPKPLLSLLVGSAVLELEGQVGPPSLRFPLYSVCTFVGKAADWNDNTQGTSNP